MRGHAQDVDANRAGAALRATAIVPVAALVFVIAYGGLGIGRDATARLHSLRNPGGCIECHVSTESPELNAAGRELCERCHDSLSPRCDTSAEATVEHCTRCHDPHGKVGAPFLLRPSSGARGGTVTRD